MGACLNMVTNCLRVYLRMRRGEACLDMVTYGLPVYLRMWGVLTEMWLLIV